MCFYITATLPNGTDLRSLKGFFNKFDMAFTPIRNDIVQSQLRPGEMYFRATKDYCDCETVIGSLNTLKDYQTLLKSKKVKTLRKKKWTEEQINQWIKEKIESKRENLVRESIPKEKEIEIEKWIEFLHKLLDNKLVKHVGILKHWYNKKLSNEEISIKNTYRTSIEDLTPNLLLKLEEDNLYEFIASYKF